MSFDTQTKLAMYRHFAETGQRPSLGAVAESVGSDVSSVREAYLRLRAQRVLVLEPDGVSIRMAPPFSAVPTQHVVIVDETKYFANCAWDSFGIPAALHRPGKVQSRCEQSGEPLRTHLINRERVRCQRFGPVARREEEEYPSWIFDQRATWPQRQRSATLWARLWRTPKTFGVAPQSQNAWLCFFVAPCQPPARASRTHFLFMRWVLNWRLV